MTTLLADDLREVMGILRRLAPIIRNTPKTGELYDPALAGDRLEHHARTIDRAVSAIESYGISGNIDANVDRALEQIKTLEQAGGTPAELDRELRAILLELGRRPTPIRSVKTIAGAIETELADHLIGEPADALDRAARVVISALGFDFFPEQIGDLNPDDVAKWNRIRPLRIKRWYAFAFNHDASGPELGPGQPLPPLVVFPESACGYAPDDPEINSFVALHAGENKRTVIVCELRECY